MELSVVVPAFDEEGSVELLVEKLVSALGSITKKYEIIFVDDGSRDRTLASLLKLRGRHKRLKIISFSRNFGQSAALSAGFRHAKGKIVVTMDGDLQSDPVDIPVLLEKLGEGFGVVCGWRRFRKDSFSKRFFSNISNFLARLLSGVALHDFSCTFRVYDSRFLRGLVLGDGMHRYVPILLYKRGARVAEVPVNHFPRRAGRSKYGASRLFRGFSDLLRVCFMEPPGNSAKQKQKQKQLYEISKIYD